MSEKILPMSDGRMEIHIQRHDNHVEGHLTPEGRENARKTAEAKVVDYLSKNPDTNFMVIASDQVFDEEDPNMDGMRAKETADIITDVIKKALAERGLPEDHLFGSDSLPITLSPNLREAGIFNNGYMKHLQAQHPGENQWLLYYQDAEADARKSMGAESSHDLAERMDYVIKTAEMVGASFHKTESKKDQPLVVWTVGHGGGLDSYLHHYAGVPLEELGFPVSGGFSMYATEEGVVAEVKGKQYPIKGDENMSLPKHAI